MRSRSVPASLAAPVGGWNARDALGAMKPSDAVYLTNWWPSTTDVVLRNGYTNFATGLGSQVETLFKYSGGSTNRLFAAAGTNIYNATAGGAVGAAAVSALTNARFQYVNVSTSGGNFMLCVNGADKLRGYDGTNWWTDGDGTHDITGFDTSKAAHITLFKNRVWMLESGTLNAWYLGTSSIAGAATKFPLQSIARLGGYLMAIATWTFDGGYGMDDMLAFVTSEGEVIVYNGLDPAQANTWQLSGVWALGRPVGRRCLYKYSGDLLLISQDGLIPLSSGLQSSQVNPQVALSNKIMQAMSTATGTYGSNFGWQSIYYPKQNALLVNVPVATGSQQQYVMNTITKAWCNFSGWNANCFEVFNDELYFGGNGIVGKAWVNNDDAGTNISADGKQAFNYFGSEGTLKRWTMMRPILSTNGSPGVLASLNVDFDDTAPTSPVSYAPSASATWDSGTWDQVIWGGGNSIQKQWQGVTGVGYCAAPRLKIVSQGIDVHWMSTDLVMEAGAIL